MTATQDATIRELQRRLAMLEQRVASQPSAQAGRLRRWDDRYIISLASPPTAGAIVAPPLNTRRPSRVDLALTDDAWNDGTNDWTIQAAISAYIILDDNPGSTWRAAYWHTGSILAIPHDPTSLTPSGKSWSATKATTTGTATLATLSTPSLTLSLIIADPDGTAAEPYLSLSGASGSLTRGTMTADIDF